MAPKAKFTRRLAWFAIRGGGQLPHCKGSQLPFRGYSCVSDSARTVLRLGYSPRRRPRLWCGRGSNASWASLILLSGCGSSCIVLPPGYGSGGTFFCEYAINAGSFVLQLPGAQILTAILALFDRTSTDSITPLAQSLMGLILLAAGLRVVELRLI